MRLFIPTIGTTLRLLQPWSFSVLNEYRNSKALIALGAPTRPDYALVWDPQARDYRMDTARLRSNDPVLDIGDLDSFDATLPAETVLRIDRIYIRKGAGDFDSITFFVVDCPNPNLKPKSKKGFMSGQLRFFVSRDDANQIEFALVPSPNEPTVIGTDAAQD